MKGVDANRPIRKAPALKTIQANQDGRQDGIQEGVGPMALGVLNNLSAIYAENNLNNTNNSLQTVLQQLSSGSRINSGADDAAGLSLVNGLGANSAALTQSETNATEGVGLLQVADGALSQVTSLLDRAVTLATEASNGTLNSTQEAAANQEYQSLLAEITNIGSTTTYNQQQVFNDTTTAIYTGDSSLAGSSVDDIFIRTLSASSVGDTGGTMSYSNGQNNVFLDLSAGGKNASVADSLNASGSTTITVNYLAKGPSGSVSPATANITVGTGTNYANTAQGLINAINASGLGLSATFGTAAQAGTTAEGAANAPNIPPSSSAVNAGNTDTGIIISGTGVGTGTNGPGEIGTLTVNASTDTLSGTLSIVGTDGKTHTLTLGTVNSTDTLANLAATINSAGYGVTATVNAAETAYGNPQGTVLTLTTSDPNVTVSANNLLDAGAPTSLTGIPITSGSFTNAIGSISTTTNAAYTGGTLQIGTYSFALAGQTASALATYINQGNYGITAQANSAGTSVTFYSANSAEKFDLTTAATVSNYNGTTVTPDTVDTTTNQSLGAGTLGTITLAAAGDTLSGSLTIDGKTFNTATAGTTLSALATTISTDLSTLGVSASVTGAVLSLTSTGSQTYLGSTFSATGLTDTTSTTNGIEVVQETPSSTQSDYYSVGITGSVADTSTTGGTTNVGFVADNNGTGGVATTSYSDGAGANLSTTDLLNQSDAVAALHALNTAITDESSLDGYLGAQINTLNAISTVMSTQQENILSAQNAVQATDYASATSNMSKYEILSQTGIAALAQANQVQQEVTKLLQ